jgi:hypothetical protein
MVGKEPVNRRCSPAGKVGWRENCRGRKKALAAIERSLQ